MIIDFEGERYELDTEHVSYKQAMGIQSNTGMSIADWSDSLDFKVDAAGELLNPPAEWLPSVGALYWLMRQQSGKPIPFSEMDFDFTAFIAAYLRSLTAEVEAAKAKAAAADPTSPPPPGPAGETTESAAPATPTTTTPTLPAPPPAAAATGS